ncbi:MAG: FAD:protein FMN transferase [Luteitalea sp.]|nr:FAD:protein FMN transferase [Luteitalea sp.]
MGTMVRIVLYAPNEATATRAARAAFERVAALDRTLSDYRPDSELSRLSARAGLGPVPTSHDLLRLLETAQRVAEGTDGAFDVTVGPLSRLWREASRTREAPSPRALSAAKAHVGYRYLRLEKRAGTVALDRPGMRLDVGGIGKGFAADEALKVLAAHGVRRALIAASGDIVVGDPPPERSGWTISLDVPQRKRRSRILLRNAAVSTSGDAEQFVVIDDVRYSHIVDPRSGLGLTPSRQATVVAPSGTASDSLATAVCVLGADRGLGLVERDPHAAALVVTRVGEDFEVRSSTRWPTLAGH